MCTQFDPKSDCLLFNDINSHIIQSSFYLFYFDFTSKSVAFEKYIFIIIEKSLIFGQSIYDNRKNFKFFAMFLSQIKTQTVENKCTCIFHIGIVCDERFGLKSFYRT